MIRVATIRSLKVIPKLISKSVKGATVDSNAWLLLHGNICSSTKLSMTGKLLLLIHLLCNGQLYKHGDIWAGVLESCEAVKISMWQSDLRYDYYCEWFAQKSEREGEKGGEAYAACSTYKIWPSLHLTWWKNSVLFFLYLTSTPRRLFPIVSMCMWHPDARKKRNNISRFSHA